jgi:hypothetical protein
MATPNHSNKREQVKYDLADPESYQRFWEQEHDPEKDPLAFEAL